MVADIMNTFINNEEVCTNLVKNDAQFSNNQKVNETVAKDPTYGSDFLGGQNDIALFCDLAKNIKFDTELQLKSFLKILIGVQYERRRRIWRQKWFLAFGGTSLYCLPAQKTRFFLYKLTN